MEFVKDFLIYEAGALCGFFIAALMNAARAGQEITIKFEEDKHGTGKEHPDGAGDRTGTVPKQVEIDPDLKALQQAVGGSIGASYPFADDPVALHLQR